MMRLSAVGLSTFLLGTLAGVQGAATLAIDLTRTHATNPDWPGHARFHVVWQSVNVALLSVLTEYILFSHLFPEKIRFYLALLLTTIPMFGFLAALFSRSAYGGTLRDRNGMPPLVVSYRGSLREIDLNLVTVIVGLIVSAVLFVVHDLWA